MHHDARQATQAPADQELALIRCTAWLITPLQVSSKWCPESEAGLFKTIVEHTAAELFDAATQDRSRTDTTMRMGVDRGKATTALIRYCQSQSYCHCETEVKA